MLFSIFLLKIYILDEKLSEFLPNFIFQTFEKLLYQVINNF